MSNEWILKAGTKYSCDGGCRLGHAVAEDIEVECQQLAEAPGQISIYVDRFDNAYYVTFEEENKEAE